MEFTTTSQATLDAGIKVFVYGEAGIGKTALVSTLPEPLLISAESGLLSLRKSNIERIYGANQPGICYDVPTIVIRTVQDMKDAYSYVATNSQALQFKTIALDSLSEIAEVFLKDQKNVQKDPRKAYGEMQDFIMDYVRAFRDLPGRNVYMSAKMESSKDELSGIVKWGPSMPGQKMGPQLPYLFDEVFRMCAGKAADGKEFRYLQTQPDLQSVAKDRSGALSPMEYPHLGALFNKIKGV